MSLHELLKAQPCDHHVLCLCEEVIVSSQLPPTNLGEMTGIITVFGTTQRCLPGLNAGSRPFFLQVNQVSFPLYSDGGRRRHGNPGLDRVVD